MKLNRRRLNEIVKVLHKQSKCEPSKFKDDEKEEYC